MTSIKVLLQKVGPLYSVTIPFPITSNHYFRYFMRLVLSQSISQLRVHERRFQTGSSLMATVPLSAQYFSRDAYEGLQLTCASQPHPFQVREPNTLSLATTDRLARIQHSLAQSCMCEANCSHPRRFYWPIDLGESGAWGGFTAARVQIAHDSKDWVGPRQTKWEEGSPVGLHLPAQPARKHSKAPAASTLCRTTFSSQKSFLCHALSPSYGMLPHPPLCCEVEASAWCGRGRFEERIGIHWGRCGVCK